MENADLTVVMPCYNAGNTILRAIDSIVIQDVLPEKLIIINDCSTDNTLEVLAGFLNKNLKFEVEVINLKVNKGASYARRIGCEKTQSKYIAFLDSDDAWHREKIKKQLYYMEKYNIDILGGIVVVTTEKKLSNINSFSLDSNDLTVRKISGIKFLFKNYYSTPSVIVRKKVILDENFSKFLRYSEDYECWRRIAFKYKAYFMNNSLTYSFKHSYISDSGSLSSNLYKMTYGEIKGLLLFYKKNFNLVMSLLTLFAIIFSILKAVRRLMQYYFRLN